MLTAGKLRELKQYIVAYEYSSTLSTDGCTLQTIVDLINNICIGKLSHLFGCIVNNNYTKALLPRWQILYICCHDWN